MSAMQKIEVAHNTPEQVREYIVAAIDLADELADRESPAWRAIFRAAYDGHAGKQIVLQQAQPVDLSQLMNNNRGR